jgi:hypothetical protein
LITRQFLGLLGKVAVATVMTVTFVRTAGADQAVNRDRSGLAVRGHDVVAYYTEGKPVPGYSKSVQRQWQEDIPGNIRKADANWPGLRDKKH